MFFKRIKKLIKENNKLLKNLEEDIEIIKNSLKKDNIDKNNIRNVNIDGYSFLFSDLMFSKTIPFVSNEIGKNSYDFSDIDFKEGDVVIDIGGNIGMISIYLAKKFPFLKIYAFEPVKRNYENFLKNIKLNNIPDGIINIQNKAVTKDGRSINIITNSLNTGGSSLIELKTHDFDVDFLTENISSITLNDIFNSNNIKACKLLKIDCEGSEYEILYNTNTELLKRCENLRGEFHDNKELKEQNLNSKELLKFCKNYIKNVSVEYHNN